MPTILTPALAKLCLDVAERRQRDPWNTAYALSIVEEALLIQSGQLAPVYRKAPKPFPSGGLKHPSWKHDKGSRG